MLLESLFERSANSTPLPRTPEVAPGEGGARKAPGDAGGEGQALRATSSRVF